MAALQEKDPRFEEAEATWREGKNARAEHERTWEEISRWIRPIRRGHVSGEAEHDRQELPVDSSPIIAAQNWSAQVYSTLTNPASPWFEMDTTDPDLANWHPMRMWLDQVTRRVMASFAPAVSPFYSSTVQAFADISAFGNMLQVAERPMGERRIMDQTISMAEAVFFVDGFGAVEEVVRRFRLTAVQAAGRFGMDALPDKLREKAQNRSRDKAVYYHHIRRNRDYEKNRAGPRGKRWASIYACEEGGVVVRHSGYDDMPVIAARWEVDTGDAYGLGPGWAALPEVRKITLMSRANLRAAQRAANPTFLAPDKKTWDLDGRIAPGGMVYGGVSAGGTQMLRQLDSFSGTGLSIEMQREAVSHMRDAFNWTLTSLADRTGLSALEVAEIRAERLRQMAPHMGRVQEEFLAPKIDQRFAMLWKAGQLPPPPPEAEGAPLTVKYTSAAAMAAKAENGLAAQRILADLAPLAAIAPDKMQRIGDRLDEDGLLEVLHDARGGDARMLRSRDDADKIAAARDQAMQQAQAMEMLKRGGGVAKDLASAEASLGGGR